MIAQLSLSNFKCFREQRFELRALNLLAGPNGSGKSTVVQALLTLRQSYDSGNLVRKRLQLDGRLVNLGTVGDVYCAEPQGDILGVTLDFARELGSLRAAARIMSETAMGGFVLNIDEAPPADGRWANSALFQPLFNYLHAERIGPRKSFDILPEESHPLCVGRDGANAAFVVSSELSRTPIDNEAVLLESGDGRILKSIEYQWPLWMGRLFPGFDAKRELIPQTDRVRLGIALQKRAGSGQSLYFRPTNTGFGLTYAQGIVVAGLAAAADTMLIVENPEAHLHPRAQSGIGEFLARVAAGGAQVIVETHSEHVLNGMRRAIKQTVLRADAAKIFFFDSAEDGAAPTCRAIEITGSGRIPEWPDGFFDQLDKDLGIILE